MEREPGTSRAAVRMLVRFADGVLGPPDPSPELPEGWGPCFAVAGLIAAIIIVRRVDAVTNPQFWAEDGYLYFVENATLGFFPALAKLCNGYPNLLQRSIAFLGGLVPAVLAPRIYTTSAIAITALSIATFCLPAFRHVVRSDRLRVLFCAAVVSMPFETEVLSTPTNLGWLIALWLSLLSIMRLPRKRWRVTLLAVAGGCAVLSTPLAPVNLPFWLLRAGRAVVRGDRRELGFAVALVAALASVVVFTGGMGATTELAISSVGSVTITFRTWWIHTVSRVTGLLLPRRPGMPSAADYGVAAVIGLLVIAAAFVERLRNLPPLLVAVYFALTSIALELAGQPPIDFPNIYQMPVRYTVYPVRRAELTMGRLVLAVSLIAALLLARPLGAEQAGAPASGNEESNTQLAKKTQNPVADLISVPFQNNFNFNTGPENRTVWILNVQPVIPIHLSDDWNLITRIIMPIINQPSLAPGIDHAFGLGDINPTFFFSPVGSEKFIWGAGPTFTFPTASNRLLGTGKYSAGPAAVALTMQRPWSSARWSTTSGRSPAGAKTSSISCCSSRSSTTTSARGGTSRAPPS